MKMQRLYVIRYSKNGEWLTSAPMSKKVATKHAELLTMNGYDTRIIEVSDENSERHA